MRPPPVVIAGAGETHFLRVVVDRVEPWSLPGMLFLGDAAHTMSPAGGERLNLAIQDSVCGANHFVRCARLGQPVDQTVLARIEAERRPEIEAVQAAQARIGRMVLAPMVVQHLMFTALGVAVRLDECAAAGSRHEERAPRISGAAVPGP